jgi:cytochrome c oxidase assembly factor CtaG
MLLVGTSVFLLMVVVPMMLLGITVLSVLAVLCVGRNRCPEEQAQHGCAYYCCYFHKEYSVSLPV